MTEKTKLIAVGYASNVTGTITDVKRIAELAKAVGALTIVDAVHAVPHFPVDFEDIQADLLLCSGYKFFGPHVGVAVIKEQLFQSLQVYKLEPAPKEAPYKLETGTQNHEGIAGLKGAIQFLASLGGDGGNGDGGIGDGVSLRGSIIEGMKRLEVYENSLAEILDEALRSRPGITLYRADHTVDRTPTFAFTIEGKNSHEVCRWLAENYNMCVADGDFYASTLGRKLNIDQHGGWIRVGLAPYNTREEINLLIEAIDKLNSNKVLNKI